MVGITRGIFKRLATLPVIAQCDIVFIHREAAPLGPPLIEWFIAKILRKKIIYDFDDAIWLPNTSVENRISTKLKFHSKVARICRWSYKISAGNDYLAKYARKFNPNVVINPTTVDSEQLHNRIKDHYSGPPAIGWTGSHSTIKYLWQILPTLQRLEKIVPFQFIVIADKDPSLPLQSYQFRKWNKDSEIDDLLAIHIGVMPLSHDLWAQGKCGFKLLQYLALGIPAVASPVGVNKRIIDPDKNGFLCSSENEWLDKLKLLLQEPDLRREMGKCGRQKIENQYSVRSNDRNFLNLFS